MRRVHRTNLVYILPRCCFNDQPRRNYRWENDQPMQQHQYPGPQWHYPSEQREAPWQYLPPRTPITRRPSDLEEPSPKRSRFAWGWRDAWKERSGSKGGLKSITYEEHSLRRISFFCYCVTDCNGWCMDFHSCYLEGEKEGRWGWGKEWHSHESCWEWKVVQCCSWGIAWVKWFW